MKKDGQVWKLAGNYWLSRFTVETEKSSILSPVEALNLHPNLSSRLRALFSSCQNLRHLLFPL